MAAADERLVFVPSRLREWGTTLAGSVLVPLWIAAPLLLPALGVAALTGSAFVWALFWIVLGLTALAVVGLTAGMLFTESTAVVRWIEFRRPPGAETGAGAGPTAVVVARFLRASTVDAADLQRVVVVERFRLGRRESIAVVLHTRGGTVECRPTADAALSRGPAETLVDWLGARLGPAGVPVEHRTEVDRNFLRPDEWWTPSELAARWQVPVDEVDGLAERYGVRSYQYTPRAAAMYSPHRTVTVYDPGRAHEVAAELRAERTAGLEPPEPGDGPRG